MPNSAGTAELAALRSELLRQRAQLSAEQVSRAAWLINRHLWQLPALARCRRLACYVAVRKEADCRNVIAEAWSRNREVFLPVLHAGELRFAAYRPDTSLVANCYAIPEPAPQEPVAYRGSQLDVVLVPLVGFDERGTRLGMGGGYYDRTFRYLLHRAHWRRPRLIGIAYEFQRVDALRRKPWDVPLDTVVTDQCVYKCRPLR